MIEMWVPHIRGRVLAGVVQDNIRPDARARPLERVKIVIRVESVRGVACNVIAHLPEHRVPRGRCEDPLQHLQTDAVPPFRSVFRLPIG